MNLAPIFPQRRADPISEPGWAAELKLDGFRGLADTINGRILSKKPQPAETLPTLARRPALRLRFRRGDLRVE
jgi:hypothetical protein